MNSRGALVVIGVLVAFLALFVPLARWVIGGRNAEIDVASLRRTYVALALYESTHDGLPAPNLGLVRQDLDPADLRSVSDPSSEGKDFPLDPAVPSLPLRSPSRVSWSYVWHWPDAGKPAVLDPRKGVLASWWGGAILRMRGDGSLVERPRRDSARLAFGDLFGE